MPRAKVTRGLRSLLLQETSQAKTVHSGRGLARLSPGPPPPHKLSLLEVVLAASSGSRAQSRRSQFSGTLPSVPSIQGWAAIWSSEGLSEGRRERHHSISCWHSAERTGVRVLRQSCPAPNTAPGCTTHLGRPSSGKRACRARSPRPAQRECPHTPCRRAIRPETTQWQTARGIGDIGSTLGGCTHGCLREILGTHQDIYTLGVNTVDNGPSLSFQPASIGASENLACHHPGKTPTQQQAGLRKGGTWRAGEERWVCLYDRIHCCPAFSYQ